MHMQIQVYGNQIGQTTKIQTFAMTIQLLVEEMRAVAEENVTSFAVLVNEVC